MKKDEEIIQRTIEHWEGMIKWAKGRPKMQTVNILDMGKEIGQDWCGDSCPLCSFYIICSKCPLGRKHGHCSPRTPRERGDNAWEWVARSGTWGFWTRNAQIMLNQLKGLL